MTGQARNQEAAIARRQAARAAADLAALRAEPAPVDDGDDGRDVNGPAPGRVRPVADETTSAYEAFLDRLDLSPDFNALEARDTLRRLLEKESYWRTRLAHAQDTILRRRAERRIDELEVEIGSLWSIVHPPVVEGEDPPPGAIARARCRYCGTGIEERLQTECATCGAGWSKPPTT